jgi:hypothetical protein
VEKISLAVNNYFAILDGGGEAATQAAEGEEQPQEASAEEAIAADEAVFEAPAESESQEAAASTEAEPASVEENAAEEEGGEAMDSAEPKQ